MRYEDFVIQLGPDDGDGHPVQVLKSPAGEGTGRFHPPIDQEQMQRLWHNQERVLHERGASREAVSLEAVSLEAVPPLPTRDAKPSSPGSSEAKLGAVGVQLFDTLFSGQVRRLYDHSQGAIGASPEVGLRIKLKLDPGEPSLAPLYGLPWEFLYQTETDDALCLSRRTPLVRYLDVPRPVKPIPLPAVLRVLVVMSSPAGLPPLALERERALIEEAWGQHPELDVVFLPRATSGALRQAILENSFHVLHFMGHGGFDARTDEGVLFLEGDDGSAHPIGGRALAAKLKDFDSLGLVFLNACKTARVPAGSSVHPFSGVSSALVLGGVPAIVAMQFPISDRAAIKFSEGFYRCLAQGDSVDEAVTEGRQAIHSSDSGSMEWGTPVLFVRVPNGTVFEHPGASPKNGVRARWINAAASILTLLLMIFVVAGGCFREERAVEVQDMLASNRTFPVEIGHVFTTSVEGLSGQLVDIELLPSGRMRLNFEFNNSTDRELDLDFFNGRTYLVDDSGNRYGVISTYPDGAPQTGVRQKVSAGGTGRCSLEFPSPRRGAEVLNIGLEPTSREEGVRPEFFQIEIAHRVPAEFFQEPEPIQEPDGKTVRGLEGTVLFSNVNGFEGTVVRVVLLDQQAMRWTLEFFNRSGEDQTLSLQYDQIYLADEYGNRYPVLRSSQHMNGEAVNAFEGPVQRGVRVNQWLEFPAPIAGARRFVLHLAGTADSLLRFKSRALWISGADTRRYSRPVPQVPASSVLVTWEVDKEIDNNIGGLESRLDLVQLLHNGHTRWHLRLFNRSSSDLTVGLNHNATYLVDNSGYSYEMAATSTAAAPNEIVEILLQPRLREDVWLEFSPPREGANAFKLQLISHDEQHLSYSVIEVGPLVDLDASEPAPKMTRTINSGSQFLPLDQSSATMVENLDDRLDSSSTVPYENQPARPLPLCPPIAYQPLQLELTSSWRDLQTRPKKGKKSKAGNFQPGPVWQGYFKNMKNGLLYEVKLPMEQNKDKDWIGLHFTDYEGPRTRIAVMEVKNKLPEGNGVEIVLAGIEELMTTALIRTNRFDVIEREALVSIPQEQDFGQGSQVSEGTPPKIGKALGAEYFIFSTVNELGSSAKDVGRKKVGPLGGIGVGKKKSEVTISFRVVDGTSGQVLHSVTERSTVGSWSMGLDSWGLGGLGYEKGNPVSYAVQSCLNKAAYRIAMWLKEKTWSGSVIQVDNDRIYINAGNAGGIASGMALTVMAKGESLIDPETGLDLGAEAKVIGSMVVTTVKEKFSIGNVVQGCAGVKRGDRVEFQSSAYDEAPSTPNEGSGADSR